MVDSINLHFLHFHSLRFYIPSYSIFPRHCTCYKLLLLLLSSILFRFLMVLVHQYCYYIRQVNGVNWRIYCFTFFSVCPSVHPSVCPTDSVRPSVHPSFCAHTEATGKEARFEPRTSGPLRVRRSLRLDRGSNP